MVGGTLGVSALTEETFTLTQSQLHQAEVWVSPQPLWAAYPNAKYSAGFLLQDDFQLCLRCADLIKTGFVRPQEVLESPVCPAGHLHCQQLSWPPELWAHWGWELWHSPSRGQWLRDLCFEGVSGQISVPTSLLGWFLHCCQPAELPNSAALDMFRTHQDWNLIFLSFTWKIDNQREADPDCSWGYDPAGFVV